MSLKSSEKFGQATTWCVAATMRFARARKLRPRQARVEEGLGQDQDIGTILESEHGRTPRSWELGTNLGPEPPKHRVKRGVGRHQKARRVNNLSAPASSAEPPSPVQIRTAPPPFLRNVSRCRRGRRKGVFYGWTMTIREQV